MSSAELKVTRIGNSRGVRLPATTLERYGIGESVVMEERSDGILLRPLGETPSKLSWTETAREMASEAEDWTDWESTSGDGLDRAPWIAAQPKHVAERARKYRAGRRRRKK